MRVFGKLGLVSYQYGRSPRWYNITVRFLGPAASSPFGPCSNEGGGCYQPSIYLHQYGPQSPLTETWCANCWHLSN